MPFSLKIIVQIYTPMKKAILFIILTGLFIQVSAPPSGLIDVVRVDPINPYEKLWEVFCEVESGNDPYAVGDTHLVTHSYGIVQLRQIRLDDYYLRTGKRYFLQDCYDIQISKEIWLFYASKFHHEDIERISRSWNGYGQSSILYAENIKRKVQNSL